MSEPSFVPVKWSVEPMSMSTSVSWRGYCASCGSFLGKAETLDGLRAFEESHECPQLDQGES